MIHYIEICMGGNGGLIDDLLLLSMREGISNENSERYQWPLESMAKVRLG